MKNYFNSILTRLVLLSFLCTGSVKADLRIGSLNPSPGDLSEIIQTLTFDMGESLLSGNLSEDMEFTGAAIGSEFAVMGIEVTGSQVEVLLNSKMLSGNLELVFHAQNLVGVSGNTLSGDNIFSYTIGQPTFSHIEIEREDGKFIIEGKMNFGTSVELLVPTNLAGNATLDEHYRVYFYLDDEVDSVLTSSNLILPVIPESDEVKMVFASTNVLVSDAVRDIDVIFSPGEGYFMNEPFVKAQVYVRGTEMLTESELTTSITEGSTRALTYDISSGNSLNWSFSDTLTGHGFSEEAFDTVTTSLTTTSNVVYFHADGDPGPVNIDISDNGSVVQSLQLTVFATGSDNKFLEPETSFNPYSTPADYELVSFPLNINSYAEFNQLMEPLLGTMGPSNYLIYGYDSSSSVYRLADNSALDFTRGRAFWMARVQGGKVEFLGNATAFTEQVSLSLQTGWHMIGNPYGDQLDVRDIVINQAGEAISLTSPSNSSTDPWIWVLSDSNLSGSSPSSSSTYSFGSILEPMQGGWIYVIDPNVEIVFSPRLFSDTIPSIKPRLSSDNVLRRPPDPPGSSSSSSGGASGGGCLLKTNGKR